MPRYEYCTVLNVAVELINWYRSSTTTQPSRQYIISAVKHTLDITLLLFAYFNDTDANSWD